MEPVRVLPGQIRDQSEDIFKKSKNQNECHIFLKELKKKPDKIDPNLYTCELRFDAVGREGGHLFRRAVKEDDVDDIITNVPLPFQLRGGNKKKTKKNQQQQQQQQQHFSLITSIQIQKRERKRI